MGVPADSLPQGRWPKSHRVRTRLQYQAVQTGGARVVSPHFVFLLNAQAIRLEHGRIGVTASRKVGGAVIRNRAKRLVREAFRATRDLWPGGVDVVVVVRSFEQESKLGDVVAEWRSVASKLARQVQGLQSKALAARTSAPEKAETPC